MSCKDSPKASAYDSSVSSSVEFVEESYKNGADAVVAALERAGVDTVFAYPGGASMVLHQSLTRSRKIRTVLPRHEQGGAFMAEGYARASGKVGVCMATSGPGATNLVTGIADAYMDSVPLVAITGQVKREMIGRGAFQETDVFGLTLPIVKHSYLVISPDDIPSIVQEAVLLARSGRPGPVLLDIPKDVQQAPVHPRRSEGSFGRHKPVPRASDEELEAILVSLEMAERPLLYVGGGILAGEAWEALRRFAEKTRVPVTTTLMGIGCFPETHELSLRWLGMHGTVYANYAADACDLLLAMGVRFDDRVTGNVDEFAKGAKIIHVDVDSSELNKNKRAHLPILGDIHDTLDRLNGMLESERRPRKDFKAWHAQLAQWKARYPFSYRPVPGAILPQQVVEELFRLTKGEAIVTTGVGQHQMWAAQFYQFTQPRSFLSSSGLGTMGFGYPAALGAKVAFPNRQVIDIDGDGSFLMNIQELATAVTERIPAKAIILNNQHLGMVVQWEDRFFAGNRAHTFLGDPRNASRYYPSYRTICEGFGVPAEEVRRSEELRPALERLLAAETPYVVDVHVPYTEHVLPMIPAGMTVRDIILGFLPEDDPASAERGRAS
ncbi:acetolactate synthase I/II/III large subunit [Methylacidimicrobium cyclopophantes]|uniref:Acetolactate synthase n=1 Tax=Methylacidimicrobium cyclopophantes TaxID=1041766 RepID=A0A5E6M862_9BACT|nr:biosynthetic-type acetolactate synthase large subunit [Methylacidimicrobium cyclopophantes]VVM05427.1 acetolactate synthase I/II/III large subunit [Methylacidimicrobium cyclopophantes]